MWNVSTISTRLFDFSQGIQNNQTQLRKLILKRAFSHMGALKPD